MGAFENVTFSFYIFRMLIVVLGVATLTAGVVAGMHAMALLMHSSVTAGLIGGAMSASSMHNDVDINIDWNLKPVVLAVTDNLLVATTDNIGWVAFPGMVTEAPEFEGVVTDFPGTSLPAGKTWLVWGNTVTNMRIRNTGLEREVLVQ